MELLLKPLLSMKRSAPLSFLSPFLVVVVVVVLVKMMMWVYMIQWLMPSEGGYLEADGPVEKTWRIKQEDIRREVDISSSRNQHDVILPGLLLIF